MCYNTVTNKKQIVTLWLHRLRSRKADEPEQEGLERKMKARIMNTPKEKILIYGFDEEKTESFRRVAGAMKTELCVLPPESAGEQVGYLAGFAGFVSTDCEKTCDSRQCVIFSCMDGKKLSRTVDEMRSKGLGGIPLKAAVTGANQTMTLTELMNELEKEHRIMHGGEGDKDV